MSNFFTNSLLKPLQQWYSEINSATLTGAIDVIVVEQEDGSFLSSPFHVRFGKLGVLKAKEKIVDIEINDESVDIHMKLDDHGTSFFVEDVTDSEDGEDLPPELATSPIPGQLTLAHDQVAASANNMGAHRRKSSVSRSLIEEFNAAEEGEEESAGSSDQGGKGQQDSSKTTTPTRKIPGSEGVSEAGANGSGLKGKQSRKKRKRRAARHSRNGSKAPLLLDAADEHSSGSSSGDVVGMMMQKKQEQLEKQKQQQHQKNAAPEKDDRKDKQVEIFELDCDENDGDLDDDDIGDGAALASSTPMQRHVVPVQDVGPESKASESSGAVSMPVEMTSSMISNKSDGGGNAGGGESFLSSRLGGQTIDSILETQKMLEEQQDEPSTASGAGATKATSGHYFSEPDMTPMSSPLGSRPGTPIMSDTELDVKHHRKPSLVKSASVAAAAAAAAKDPTSTEQSWEWGQLPKTVQSSKKGPDRKSEPGSGGTAGGLKSVSEDGAGSDAAQAEASGSGRQRRWTFAFWNSRKENEKAEDDAIPGVYLDDLKDDEEMMAIYVGSGHRQEEEQQRRRQRQLDDDDTESGNGPSLPMSPFEHAGARSRNDSSDDDQRTQFKSLPDVSFSLCGGLADRVGAVPASAVASPASSESNPAGATTAALVASTSSSAGVTSDAANTISPGDFSPLLFEQGLLSFDDFVMRLKNQDDVFSNPDLVVRIGHQYYTWAAACPIIMSAVLYGRSLPSDLAKIIQGSYQEPEPVPSGQSKETSPDSKERRSSSWWPFSSRRAAAAAEAEEGTSQTKTTEEANDEAQSRDKISEVPEAESTGEAMTEKEGESSLGTEASVTATATALSNDDEDKDSSQQTDLKLVMPQPSSSTQVLEEDDHSSRDGSMLTRRAKKYKKTLRLGSNAIRKLNLQYGSNEAEFSVTTAYQGTTRCKCHVYLWKHTDKLVISDIDGTITKSDVLGHLLPIVGKDWAQSGVASLFSRIASNGYHIAYLSARAIGQAAITKDYLSSIRQGDMNLPDGPMFLNPTSLVSAFHTEVIERKPEQFKIKCMRDIRSLFPEDRNPFHAAYGNRVNDVFAYRSVGIPISRIFTINTKGELRHEHSQTFQTSYDCQSSIVDHLFPPANQQLTAHTCTQEYSSFTYWREPIPEVEDILGPEVKAGPEAEPEVEAKPKENEDDEKASVAAATATSS